MNKKEEQPKRVLDGNFGNPYALSHNTYLHTYITYINIHTYTPMDTYHTHIKKKFALIKITVSI